MAVTPVKIEIEGYKPREVLMVTYEFDQSIDTEGQMDGIPRGGKITIRLKTLNDGSPDLAAWMLEAHLAKNGNITFNETKSGKKMKEIKFEGAYCVGYQEHWKDKEDSYEEIEITCKKIDFGGAVYENDWK
ncbi:MAG: hypothetical protein MJZ93_00570 [Paludibacteraceae bacterium]|nr:hypothetical protein [Paludibacteraceae bacterium]